MSEILLLLLSPSADGLQFQVREDRAILLTGRFARIGRQNAFFESHDGVEPYSESVGDIDHRVAMRSLIDRLHRNSHIVRLSDINAIIYRIPHGGGVFSQTAVMNREQTRRLHSVAYLSPDLPACVMTLDAAIDQLPHTAHVAVFDTGLTSTLPPESTHYALDPAVAQALHLRRFGFEGIAHTGAISVANDVLRKSKRDMPRRVVSVHIDDRTSVVARVDNVTVDSSTGLTIAEGLPGLSGIGSTDPRLPLYLAAVTASSPAKASRVLTKRSGLAAMTGRSTWVEIERGARERDRACLDALMLLSYRIAKEVAGMTAATGGLDALLFSGNGASWVVIEEVCRRLAPFGVHVTKNPRSKASSLISTPKSSVRVVHVIVNAEEALLRAGLEALGAHDAALRVAVPIRRKGTARPKKRKSASRR